MLEGKYWNVYCIRQHITIHRKMDKLDTLINAARTGDTETLKKMIKEGIDLNQKDEKGYTPLIIACYNNKLDAATLLLESGANIDASDFGGNTALMGVSFKGYPLIAKLLLDKGANPDLQHGNGGTAMMFAAMSGNLN